MHAVQARPGPMRALSGDAPRCFYAGTDAHPIYVDQVQPRGASTKAPVVMVHGGGHTGACYMATPDLRPGWAQRFAAAGRDVFVPDWPGHGRSPMQPDFQARTRTSPPRCSALLEEIGPAVLLVHRRAARWPGG